MITNFIFFTSFNKDRGEKVYYADQIRKYDRRGNISHRDIIITERTLYFIATEKIPNGPNKGKLTKVIKRSKGLGSISEIVMR